MITAVKSAASLNIPLLSQSILGRRMLSYLNAYGVDYDFCRFFKVNSSADMFMFNSTLIICGNGEDISVDELLQFIAMHRPFRIEGSQEILCKLTDVGGYKMLKRSVFELTPTAVPDDFDENCVDYSPKLSEAYEILRDGFPNLAEYDLWLTDTSHRIRHGISELFVYKNCSVASILYDIDDFVLIGQVATKKAQRGQGSTAGFLKWLAQRLKSQGKSAFLNCLEAIAGYYEHIGFTNVYDEIVFERNDHA